MNVVDGDDLKLAFRQRYWVPWKQERSQDVFRRAIIERQSRECRQ